MSSKNFTCLVCNGSTFDILTRMFLEYTNSLFDEYSEYQTFFDVVVFRHVLEHMTNPSEAFLKLRTFMKPEALLYIALPNAAQPSVNKGFRTSFLRPVHISYFCSGNVLRLADTVKLKPIATEEDDEIFCLLTTGKVDSTQVDYYLSQKNF